MVEIDSVKKRHGKGGEKWREGTWRRRWRGGMVLLGSWVATRCATSRRCVVQVQVQGDGAVVGKQEEDGNGGRNGVQRTARPAAREVIFF
ncbi:unnamed protein product [Chondrus crispus]|uniref:Uncharacterized protein n=1 Tax=Chondrus crispus TaxID=2769 RepID=R7QIY5_CHOCR|nr:unnamed protein product [Chondrus crispus]CDF37385.1 unnamed protein product [Chondrus crispus]|eukprot:XP_005717204.1 unnamed protein product [Chondrus crispus]